MNFYLLFTLAIGFVVMCRWKSKGMGFFLFFLLFFLAVCRGENVGHDTIKYLDMSYITNWGANADFSSFTFNDLGAKVELISNFMYSMIAFLNINTRFVLVFYAFFMMFFLYLACRRFKVSTAYTLTFFVIFGFFFYSLSAARQFCAVSIILYSMSFLPENGKKRYLFFVWLITAALIHSFSIICLPLYFVRKLPKHNKRIGMVILILSLFVVVIRFDFLAKLSILLDVEHVSYYMDAYGDAQEFSIMRVVSYWVEISCLYYFFLQKKKSDYININNNGITNQYAGIQSKYQLYVTDYVYLLSIFVYAFLFSYDGLIGRARYNFCIIQCVYLASYFMNKPLRYAKWDVLFFISLFLLRVAKSQAFISALESDYYLFF